VNIIQQILQLVFSNVFVSGRLRTSWLSRTAVTLWSPQAHVTT